MEKEEGGQERGRTWKPIAAGILCIIAGSLIVVIPTAMLVAAGVHTPTPGDDPVAAFFIVVFFCIPSIMLGTVAVVGGIHSLRRRTWGLALAGSICALPAGLILGILAIIFVVVGKGEFNVKTPPGDISPKSRLGTALFAFFLGAFGAHRFYIGRTRTAIVMLLLSIAGWGESMLRLAGYGFFVAVWFLIAAGTWAFVDFLVAVTGSMTDKEGRLIRKR